MKLKHLTIRRFRGIRELDWNVDGRLICLIGAGDSTKSTILDAIECALTPRGYLSLVDADFYNANCNEPILIEVTVGELPSDLIQENRFGLFLRGWHQKKGLCDEPSEECEAVVTIRLTVDNSLEPIWAIVNDRQPDGQRISLRDRERLGLARIGGDVDRDLSWGRGTALSRLTRDSEELGNAILEVHRCARQTLDKSDLTRLREVATKAQEAAGELGVCPGPNCMYKPGLDSKIVSQGSSAIALHEEEIPLRMRGLGSRRLTALALQFSASTDGSILLIDELEYGLEPHRIKRVLSYLRNGSGPQMAEDLGTAELAGQVIMVTHSPVVVAELKAEHLRVVKTNCGCTELIKVPGHLQKVVRGSASALLSRKILVCEGKTEVGLIRGLERYWASRNKYLPFAFHGLEIVEGAGRNSGPQNAIDLNSLDYKVAYFGDSDEAIEPDKSTLESKGISVFLWADNCCTEQRIANDLPWKNLQSFLEEAIANLIDDGQFETEAEQSVLDSVAHQLTIQNNSLKREIDTWLTFQPDERMIRAALGQAAKSKGWFKRIDKGEKLSKILTKALPQIFDSDLATKLAGIEAWIYGP